MKTHRLKTLAPYWERVQSCQKKFEVRQNDRDFQVGDILELEYYEKTPAPKYYNWIPPILVAKITYILHGGQFGIENEYCILGIELIQ
jgi:hypothetical protein